MVTTLSMQLLMMNWLPGCYTCPQAKHNLQWAKCAVSHSCMPEYKIDNRTVYDILHQISKDTDMYPYVKQHKSKRDSRGAFYAIRSRWLDMNHVNATASEAEIYRCQPMREKRKHRIGKSTKPDMLSTISSWETLWSMGTKDLTQGQKSDTYWTVSGVTSCPQQSPQTGHIQTNTRRILMQ